MRNICYGMMLVGGLLLMAAGLLDGGVAPRPEPGPGPSPQPSPFVAETLHVLIVRESENVTPQQQAILDAGAWQDYVRSRQGRYLIHDPDSPTDRLDATWRDALSRPHGPLPWIVVSNGRSGTEGPLPNSLDGLLDLLKRFGG